MSKNRDSETRFSSPLAEAVHSIASAPLDDAAVERVRQKARLLSDSARDRSQQGFAEAMTKERRRRMRSWRVGIAAAALLSAGLGFVLVTGETAAIAQVVKSLRQVKSATYTVTQRVGAQADDITMVSLRDGVSRAERADGTVVIFDPNRKRLLRLDPATRTGTLIEGAMLKGGFDLARFLSDLDEHAVRVQPALADREFGGKRAKGFVVGAMGAEHNVWVDPETNLPLHFESERKQKGRSADGRETEIVIKETWSEFRFNDKLDAALFEVDPPNDYTVETQRLEDRERLAEAQKRGNMEELQKASSKTAPSDIVVGNAPDTYPQSGTSRWLALSVTALVTIGGFLAVWLIRRRSA